MNIEQLVTKVTKVEWRCNYPNSSKAYLSIGYDESECDAMGQKGVITIKRNQSEISFNVDDLDVVVRCLRQIQDSRGDS